MATIKELNSKVSRINKELEKIQKSSMRPVTKYTSIQQKYSPIITPQGLTNSGKIMTYSETKKFVEKYNPKNAQYFTKEAYEKILQFLENELEDRLSIEGEEQYQRERMENTIQDAMEYTGEEIDYSNFSIDELKEAFEYANEQMKQYQGKVKDSYRFYEYLLDYLKGLLPED